MQAHRPREIVQLTADLVVLTIREAQLRVLLVTRRTEPQRGWLALPGGFLRPGEDLEATAHRELAEETGLDASRLPLQQLRTYSEPERDRRGRVITTAFLAIAPDLPEPVAGSDAHTADWVEVEPTLSDRLAFDHGLILADGLEAARRELEYTTQAASFCDPTFTIPDLHRVYELVWDVQLDLSNFRRKVIGAEKGFVEVTGQKRQNPAGGPPADLYRRGPATRLTRPILRPAVKAPRQW